MRCLVRRRIPALNEQMPKKKRKAKDRSRPMGLDISGDDSAAEGRSIEQLRVPYTAHQKWRGPMDTEGALRQAPEGYGPDAAGPARSTRELSMDLLSLAVPMLAVVLAEPLLTLIDTWFIGTVLPADQAKAGLAALSANCSLFNLITCCMSCFTMSSTAVVARAGGGPKAAGQGVKNGAFLACAIASLLSGFLILYTTPVLALGYGIDPSVASFTPAVEYLRIRALAIPAILTQNVLVGVCLGVKESLAPLFGCAASALTNIVLDYLFIEGWGVAGVAAATTAASYTGILATWALLQRKICIEDAWRMPSFDDLKPYVMMSGTLCLGSTAAGQMTATALVCKTTVHCPASHP
jgi:Na+-driven multidrug efflux pump